MPSIVRAQAVGMELSQLLNHLRAFQVDFVSLGYSALCLRWKLSLVLCISQTQSERSMGTRNGLAVLSLCECPRSRVQ